MQNKNNSEESFNIEDNSSKQISNNYFFEYSMLVNEEHHEVTFVPTFNDEHQKEIYKESEEKGHVPYMVEIDDAEDHIDGYDDNYKLFFRFKDRVVGFKNYEQFEILHKFNVPEDRFLNKILDDITKPEPVTQWMF